MTLLHRLWIYQAERFPLVQHGPVVALFVAAGLLVAARATGAPVPSPWTFVAAFLLSLLLFLQLRIADEFKDADDDRRYRPERPVPRGLVSLRLLAAIAGGAAIVQLVLALTLAPEVAILLAVAWAWLGLMTVEFGVGRWLRARPLLYLVSHMAIMPLIALMVTGCVWAVAGVAPPDGAAPFVALAFANGCVVEIGRKVWAPEEERNGVETYSHLWGPERAAGSWIVMLGAAAVLTGLALVAVVGTPPALGSTIQAVLASTLLAALLLCAGAGALFRRQPTRHRSRWIPAAAAAWVIVSYLVLAVAAALALP